MCYIFSTFSIDLISSMFIFIFFFLNDTATTEIYTLSLHDALPIYCIQARLQLGSERRSRSWPRSSTRRAARASRAGDRKSTRLNSSHANISYAVFCLKKKKKKKNQKHINNKMHKE